MRNAITANSKHPYTATIIWLIAELVLLLVLWLVVGIYVPRQKQFFDSYGLQLPQLTITAINIALFLQDFWWLCLPLTVIIVVSGVVLSRHGPFSAKIGNLVSMFILLMLMISAGFFVLSFNLAQMKLAEALMK